MAILNVRSAGFSLDYQSAKLSPGCTAQGPTCKLKPLALHSALHSVPQTFKRFALEMHSYLVLIFNTLTEYAGNTRVKFVLRPAIFSVRGMIFFGFSIEFVSSSDAPANTTTSPLG